MAINPAEAALRRRASTRQAQQPPPPKPPRPALPTEIQTLVNQFLERTNGQA